MERAIRELLKDEACMNDAAHRRHLRRLLVSHPVYKYNRVDHLMYQKEVFKGIVLERHIGGYAMKQLLDGVLAKLLATPVVSAALLDCAGDPSLPNRDVVMMTLLLASGFDPQVFFLLDLRNVFSSEMLLFCAAATGDTACVEFALKCVHMTASVADALDHLTGDVSCLVQLPHDTLHDHVDRMVKSM
jgi:hypothetical protein